jgi:hypothetical protein
MALPRYIVGVPVCRVRGRGRDEQRGRTLIPGA